MKKRNLLHKQCKTSQYQTGEVQRGREGGPGTLGREYIGNWNSSCGWLHFFSMVEKGKNELFE